MNFNDNTTHLYKRGVDTHYLAFIFLLCLVLIFSYKLTYSATVDELQEQIQIITENKIKLESEIANYEKQLKDIGEQADSLKNAIKTIDTTISKNSLDIKLTENKISSTELEISKLSIKIKSNVKTIDKNLNAIAQLIKKLNIYGNYSIFENFLIYKNLSDLWNEEKDIYLIQSEGDDYLGIKGEIESKTAFPLLSDQELIKLTELRDIATELRDIARKETDWFRY